MEPINKLYSGVSMNIGGSLSSGVASNDAKIFGGAKLGYSGGLVGTCELAGKASLNKTEMTAKGYLSPSLAGSLNYNLDKQGFFAKGTYENSFLAKEQKYQFESGIRSSHLLPAPYQCCNSNDFAELGLVLNTTSYKNVAELNNSNASLRYTVGNDKRSAYLQGGIQHAQNAHGVSPSAGVGFQVGF